MNVDSPTIKWMAGEGACYRYSPDSQVTSQHDADTLYLFMDESGNLDFGKNGSRFFHMTCVAVRRPFALELPLTSLRYDFIEDGIPIEAFHACEDTPDTRYTVLKRIGRESHDLTAYTIRIEKQGLPKSMQNADTLYSKAFEWITNEVYEREVTTATELVVVITDDLPKMSKRRQVVKPLKAFMKRRFQNENIRYMLLHHKSCASVYLQIADYLSWAIQRMDTKGERWPMDLVSSCFHEIGTADVADTEEDDPS